MNNSAEYLLFKILFACFREIFFSSQNISISLIPESFPSFPFLFLFNNSVLLHFSHNFYKLKKRILHSSCLKKKVYKKENTLAQLDMLLVNHASATTLPETVPAFTAFMNMKNERLISRWKTEKDSQK